MATESSKVSTASTEQRLLHLEALNCELKEKIDNIIISANNMNKKQKELIKENNRLKDKIIELEIDLTEWNQYGRRESVEIAGIPESILQHDLEKHIINVLKSVNVNVQHYDIAATPRLGSKKNNKPRNVIIRFINRKYAFLALKNRRLLNKSNFKSYFISENLCPYNRKLFNRLYKLKKQDEIYNVWSYNGNIYMKITADDESHQIQHHSDIEYFLYDEDLSVPGDSAINLE